MEAKFQSLAGSVLQPDRCARIAAQIVSARPAVIAELCRS
jgi:hypothetical protein